MTDVTEHPAGEGKLSLCAIKDCYAGKIVGYSIDSRMKASLAVAALRNAISLRSPAATVLHSNQGSQTGLNQSSQHLDHGGVHGPTAQVDGDADGASRDAVAGKASDPSRRGACVLGEDRRRAGERGGGGGDRVRRDGPGRFTLVPRAWWHALDSARPVVGSVSVL